MKDKVVLECTECKNRNSNLTARAEAERTQMIKDKQALAARLGLPYDPKSEPPIMQSFPDSQPYPNNQSVIVQRLIRQETAKLPRLTADAQWQFARTRGAVQQFSIQSIATNGMLNYMEQGIESARRSVTRGPRSRFPWGRSPRDTSGT